MKANIQFTRAEIGQILNYAEDREREGWYVGNKQQFEKRHEIIKEKLENAYEITNSTISERNEK